jgi:hypothetical protein
MSWNSLRALPHPSTSRIAACLLVCLLLTPAAVQAQGTSEPPGPSVSPEEAPAQPARRTGWDIQGVPAINFNTDDGFGYGVILMFVDRADGNYDPFRYSVLLQLFQTTRQVASHLINVDAPRFMGSQWRMGLELGYARTLYAPYYGLGNTAQYDKALSGCEDREALEGNPDVCPDNPAFRGLRYYTYDYRSLPRVRLNARRAITDTWRLFLGYRLRMDRIRSRYTPDELGQTGNSRLIEDVSSGLIASHEGALADSVSERTSEVTFGIQYDTRKPESSPHRGMFHELSVRGGAGPIGSQFNYWGATLHTRFFHPVIPGYSRLVMGWRGLFDMMGGDVPISLLPIFGGLENRDGLGGVHSARGILSRRYQGPVKLLLNSELRWTPFSVEPFRQQFDFTFAGFLDAGRVWSNLKFSEGGGLKTSAGGGLRVVWNREFVIRMDYGVGLTEPSTGFYLDIGHIF